MIPLSTHLCSHWAMSLNNTTRSSTIPWCAGGGWRALPGLHRWRPTLWLHVHVGVGQYHSGDAPHRAPPPPLPGPLGGPLRLPGEQQPGLRRALPPFGGARARLPAHAFPYGRAGCCSRCLFFLSQSNELTRGPPELVQHFGARALHVLGCYSEVGSILAWIVILSVYCSDTIAIDLSLSALISWFMN